MANLVRIVVQVPPLVMRALEDFHKLVSALLHSTLLDDAHKIASALHDEDLRADIKRIAAALHNEDLRADVHNVGTALVDENLLESVGLLAVVSQQLRSELEPVLRTLPLLQRGTDSVELLGDAVGTLWAQTDALVGLVPGSGFMPGRSRRRKAQP